MRIWSTSPQRKHDRAAPGRTSVTTTTVFKDDDRAVSMTWEECSVSVLGGVAQAFGRFRFAAERSGPEGRYVIEGRSTFVLRRRGPR